MTKTINEKDDENININKINCKENKIANTLLV